MFQMNSEPWSMPMEQWDNEIVPFPVSVEEFSSWLKSIWSIESEELDEIQFVPNASYNWEINMDFYRGIPEKSRVVRVDGNYKYDRRTIYLKSQSLFLYEFLTEFSKYTGIKVIYVSVGSDLHIVKFDQSTEMESFLKEIHTHNTRFDE
jgi:hypothetical protein